MAVPLHGPNRDQRLQWLSPGEVAEPVVVQNIHAAKRMLIMSMDYQGIAYYELLPPKTTVTAEVYAGYLQRNLDNWKSKNHRKSVYLLHDNARPHKANVVKEFLANERITLWDHPPYSPDISLLDFCCFGQLKRRLKGIKHANWDELERNLERAIEGLNNEGHMKGVEQLPERWQRVIDSSGAYI